MIKGQKVKIENYQTVLSILIVRDWCTDNASRHELATKIAEQEATVENFTNFNRTVELKFDNNSGTVYLPQQVVVQEAPAPCKEESKAKDTALTPEYKLACSLFNLVEQAVHGQRTEKSVLLEMEQSIKSHKTIYP